MPTPIIANHNQMAILYEKYTELARSAFGYLNGRVNKYNICMLRLEHYDINVYAEFRKPNIICIKLASIINSALIFNCNEEIMRGLIVLSIAHELAHADQSGSTARYDFDPSYAKYLEDSAECVSQRFLLENRKTINNIFKCNIESAISMYGRPYPSNIEPKAFNLIDHYATSIIDVLYRDYKYQKAIYDAFNYDSVTFEFDGFSIRVKHKGQMIFDVDNFNAILNQYHQITMNTSFRLKSKVKVLSSINGNTRVRVSFKTYDTKYYPIRVPDNYQDLEFESIDLYDLNLMP